MKMIKFKEFLCIVALVLFVFFLSKGTAVSSKSAKEVFSSVSTVFEMKELSKCDKARFKRDTGFESGTFKEVLYYASDDIMQVKELMIVKLKDGSSGAALVSSLEEKVKEKAQLFKGYAPEQSAMLDSYVLEERGGFVIFAVCENSQSVLSAFKKAL